MAELQARMSSREFAEWAAYYEIEPWGDEYDAVERAMITAMVANTARDGKKKPQPYRPDEFMMRFKEQKKKRPGDALLAQVEMINRMMGGKDER